MSQSVKTGRKKRGKWIRCLLWMVWTMLVIPILQVGCVGVTDPFTTPAVFEAQSSRRDADNSRPDAVWKWIPLGDVPERFLTCVYVIEDNRFFMHWGFDWYQIRQTLADHYFGGKPMRGASTITQQCARSLFLWQGRNMVRKALEAYYTIWMELLLSKERILELYANVIEFGPGIYGIEAAAQHYYGVPAGKLSAEQCAMLVAIMPNPKVYSPVNPTDRVLQRRDFILRRAEKYRIPLDRLP